MSLPARCTGADVVAIIETDVTITGAAPDYTGLNPFLDIANEMVTECCTLQNQNYTVGRLALIETWLTAHYYAIRDERVVSEKAGSVAQSFNRTIGLGLNATLWGQQVMRLDTSGGLAAKDNKPAHMRDLPVGITWMGKPTARQAARGV